jgi:ABC-type amino acid transport system permease subunit
MEGGVSASPEFLAVLLGLVLYTSGFIAEVVRAGLASVSRGQVEAAASLSLTRTQAIRLVIMPQALRVIIPPLTSQYLNLTKNSSLAVAIGYPDVVSVATTALNNTGRAVECIAIVMAVFLTTSLTTSALMNWYNRARRSGALRWPPSSRPSRRARADPPTRRRRWARANLFANGQHARERGMIGLCGSTSRPVFLGVS